MGLRDTIYSAASPYDENTYFVTNNVLEDIVECVKTTAYIIGVIVFVVTHPIIGPLGSIACLFCAAYHGILLNYHWRHSRETDANGELICGTELNDLKPEDSKYYLNKDAQFSSEEDLARLQHEVNRLYHLQAMNEYLDFAADLFFCIIPLVGLIPLLTHVSGDYEVDNSIQQLNSHIDRLIKELNTTIPMKVFSNPQGTLFEVAPKDLLPNIEMYIKSYPEFNQEGIKISFE